MKTKKSKENTCIYISGSRSPDGLMKNTLKKLDEKFNIEFIVTGMHLSSQHGKTIVEIQKDVTIGARTRIQSHAFICELVTIGEDCFISHGAMFINDPFKIGGPARGDKSQWAETKIGDRVSIGTNATIMPVSICDDVVIGAGAVVTKDITEAGTYAGNPARRLS